MKIIVSGAGLGFVVTVFLTGLLASVPVVGQETSDPAQVLLRGAAASAKVLPAHDGDLRPHGELFPATGVGATAYDAPWFSYAGATAPLGGTNLKLSDPLVAGGNVSTFSISLDGSMVVYSADQEVDGLPELYSVPMDGTATPVRLTTPTSLCSLDGQPCEIDDDCPSVGTCFVGGEFCESNADCPGGLNNCLGIQPQSCEAVSIAFFSFQISPDGTRLLYLPIEVSGPTNLYTVPIAGPASAATQLNDTSIPVAVFFGITPDSARAIYSEQLGAGPVDLYSVPIDGTGSPTLLTTLPSSALITGFLFSPDSTNIVYVADQDTDETFELYSVPSDGSAAPTKLNGTMPVGGSVRLAVISLDSATVAYTADQDTLGTVEAYAVSITGPTGSGVKLNGPLTAGGNVEAVSANRGPELVISSDNTLAVYRADQEVNERFDIFSVPIDASATPIKLNGRLPAGGDVDTFNVSYDSTHVVYGADQTTVSVSDLYGVPIDGSLPPVLLHAGSPDESVGFLSGQGTPFYGNRAVYPFFTFGIPELYSVPPDGSQPAAKINADLPPGGFVQSVGIPFDFVGASLVSYSGQQETVGVVEAFVAPVYGNLPPLKINGPLVAGGNVVSYRINATETYGVYIADQDTEFVTELYSSLLDIDADGVPDTTDNCPRIANSGQGAVVFGQEVLAASKTAFSWPTTGDVNFARGPLDMVDSYTTNDSGSLTDVISFTDVSEPSAGQGFYYVFQPGGSCTDPSWQTVLGDEPLRDVILP